MPDFLVIKTSSLGDILQTLPSILSLKKAQPESKITWVIEKKFSSVLKPFPIDDVILVDFKNWKTKPFRSFPEIKDFLKKLRQKTFDLCIDFQGNTKSGCIMALSKAKEKRSFLHPAEWPHKLFVAKRIDANHKNCLEYYHSLIKDHVSEINYDLPKFSGISSYLQNKHVILLGLGSMWPSKKLEDDQVTGMMHGICRNKDVYFVIPALQSEKECYQNLLMGFEGEVIVKNDLVDYIPDLLASSYYIGVDSALLHLARLLKIPSKAYFGPSNANFYGLEGDVMGSCPYNIKFIKRCPYLRSCKAPCMHDSFFR